MVTGDFWVLFAMLLYFIVVVIIGFIYAKKSNRSTEEYFLGGRSLGPWLTALSAEASDMSGYLLMGLPGLAYFCGANEAVWTAIGLAIGTYLNWKFVAKRLRKYSEVAGNAITIPDFFSNRFHDKKNILMTIAAVIILLFFSIYVGSCFVTCGKLFATLFGLDYATMMVLGALVVFLYTFVGGYLAVSTTDLIQGTIMICALVIVFVGSVAQAGGVENTVAFLNSLPGFLNGTQQAVPIVDTSGNQLIVDGLPAFGEPTEYGIIAIISCLAWGLGYFGMPQVLVRFMSVKNSDEIKKSRVIAVVWVVISLFCAVAIGLIGRAVLPTEFLTNSAAENIFIVLAQMMLPSFMCGLVVSGIFAAAHVVLFVLPAHLRFSGCREHLPRLDQEERHRCTGHDRGAHHARGDLALRYLHRDRRELDHLPGRFLRLGGLRRGVRSAHAALALLEAHEPARRGRRHAHGRDRRCGVA